MACETAKSSTAQGIGGPHRHNKGLKLWDRGSEEVGCLYFLNALS